MRPRDAADVSAELMELTRKQLNFLENQVFMGATAPELQEFDQRGSRIQKLQEELNSIKRTA